MLLCLAILLLLLPQLLLAAVVRHRVPDGTFCCSLIESDSIQCCLSLQTRLIFNVCTPWQYRRIYGLDLPTAQARLLVSPNCCPPTRIFLNLF